MHWQISPDSNGAWFPPSFPPGSSVLVATFPFLVLPARALGVAPGDLDSLNAAVSGSHVAVPRSARMARSSSPGASAQGSLARPRSNIARLPMRTAASMPPSRSERHRRRPLSGNAGGRQAAPRRGIHRTPQPNGAASSQRPLADRAANPNGSSTRTSAPRSMARSSPIGLARDGKILAGGSFANVASNDGAAPASATRNLARFTAEGLSGSGAERSA